MNFTTKSLIRSVSSTIAAAACISTLACATAWAQSGCTNPPAGLVSWWRAEGNAYDVIGTNHGSPQNGSAFAAGLVSSAFSLDGVNDYVFVNASSNLNVGLGSGFTIEGWIYPTTLANMMPVVEFERALGTFSGADVGVQFWISVPPGAGTGPGCFMANLKDTGGGDHTFASAPNLLVAGAWQHVALSYDKSSGAATIQLNGAVVSRTILGSFIPQTSYHLLLGARTTFGSASSPPNAFAGKLDEMSLYNRALSTNEIQAIYAAGSAGKCFTPVAASIATQPTNVTVVAGGSATFSVVAAGTPPLSYQWTLNGTNIAGATSSSLTLTNVQLADAGAYAVVVTNIAGSAISSNAVLTVNLPPPCTPPPAGLVAWWKGESDGADSGGANNGVLFGGVTFAGGKIGQGFKFDGLGSHVEIPDSPASRFTNELTLELWYKDTGLPAGAGAGLIAKRNEPVGCNFGVNMYAGSSGIIQAYFLDTYYGLSIPVVSCPLPAAGVFHHLAVSFRQASAEQVEIRIYVDGSLVKSGTLPGNLARTLTATPVTIGSSTTTGGEPFLGVIDEVSLYNRALTASEITGIFSAGSAGKCFTPVAPSIVMQPTNLTATLGGNATFNVGATGMPSPGYQWSFNGTNLAGRTAASLTLTNVQLTQAGNYSVLVSNVAGAVSSSNAVLTVVLVPPTIVSQPVSQSVYVGANASFSVTASGSPPFSYQWSVNGTNLTGATRSNFTVTNAQFADAGSYSVVVTNLVGTAVSSNAALTVNPPPPCAAPPAGLAGWWRGEGNGLDAVGTNHGTLAGNTIYGPGRVGQGFVLDGNTDAIRLGNATNLRLQDFTIETWIKRASTSLVTYLSGYDGLFFSYGAGGYGFGLSWIGKPLLSRITADSWTPNVSITDTNFHHLAVTKSGTNVVFFVDGVAYPAPGYTSTFTFTTAAAIGARGDTLANSFLGRVDELSIYNRPLTTNEVQAIYAAGMSGKCASAIPPSIYAQPVSQAVTVGTNVTFSVTVGGPPPLNYQWTFNGTNISGATASSLSLTNVQRSQAGLYAVVVTNLAGSATSSNAVLTVNFPPATVRVANVTNASAASVITLPVVLEANGNENALGFSLNFNPSLLTYLEATNGSGGIGASLLVNANQVGAGQVGVIVSLPPDATFAPGSREVLLVSFLTGIFTTNATTSVSFGNTPVTRQLSDTLYNPLPANYTNGTVTIAAAQFEGDSAPRPDGDKSLAITDWVLLGRYAARLDYPTNAAEFQRADCAPRTTLGDGAIKVTDWVQAGRYAAGLDPLTVAGGPTTEVSGSGFTGTRTKSDGRELRVNSTNLFPGQICTLAVNLIAQGDENALGFSLAFDPAVLSFVGLTKGSAAASANLNVNANEVGTGRLGLVMSLPLNSKFAAGTQEVARVSFRVLASATSSAAVTFGDQPVPREVSNPLALPLAADYLNGVITVSPLPTLRIELAGTNFMLGWPLWATNFVLQEAATASLPTAGWHDLPNTPTPGNNENQVLLPLTPTNSLYRLRTTW